MTNNGKLKGNSGNPLQIGLLLDAVLIMHHLVIYYDTTWRSLWDKRKCQKNQ